MKSLSIVAAAALLLAACATNVEHRVALPENVKGALQVTSVNAEPQGAMMPHVPPKLEQAVRAELNKRSPGTKPASLKMKITRFEVASSSSRFWTGMFAGTNYMDVDVSVLDGAGVQIAAFTVKRESNPGGYGAFYDQETATVEMAAEAIVKTLYGEP